MLSPKALSALGNGRDSTPRPKLYYLDKKLVRISKAGDYIDRRRLIQGGAQIFGRGGGGKSFGAWRNLKIACLDDGHGMLELCCKPEAAQEAIKLARERKQGHRVLHVRPGTHVYRFIKDAIKHHADGKGVVEQVVDRILEAEAVANRKNAGAVDGAFWGSSKRQLLRDCCFTDMLAHHGELSLVRLLQYIQSLPTSFQSLNQPHRHAILPALEMARRNCPKDRQLEFDLAERYFTSEIPLLSPETRSSISINASVSLNPLLRYPLIDLLDGQGEEIDPGKCIDENKIVVLDISSKVYGETVAKIAGVLFKVGFQEALHRRYMRNDNRQYDEHNLFGIWADESQNFISPSDLRFVDTCRSTRGYLVYSTQNLSGYIEELGSTAQAEKIVQTLLANLNIIIGHANACAITNEWLSKRIASEWMDIPNDSYQRDPESGELVHGGRSYHRQLVPQFPPETFMHLQHGSETSKPKFVAEAVVTMGTPLKNGKRGIIVGFPQKEHPRVISVLWEKTPFARNWVRHVKVLSVIRHIWRWDAFMPKFRLWANFWSDGLIFPDVSKDEMFRDWEEGHNA